MPTASRIPIVLRAGALALSLGAIAGLPAAAAIPAACQPGVDAIIKQIGLPSHIYSTLTGSSSASEHRTDESIYAGGAIYIKVKGVWRRSRMSTADMQKQQQENERDTKGMTCRYLRDEAVNGEAAAVYSSITKNENENATATIWVSKSRGVPLRIERDDNEGDKSHLSIRYEYGAVQPPAGVK